MTKISIIKRFFYIIGQPIEQPNPDEDPLPNEENSLSENNSNNGQSHNDLVTINVTNEMGQTKPHLSNWFALNAISLSSFWLILICVYRDKTDAEDNDITDIHQHIGGHHKVLTVTADKVDKVSNFWFLSQQNKYVSWCKTIVLLIVWLMFTFFLMSKNEKVLHYRQLAIPKGDEVRSEFHTMLKKENILKLISSSTSFHSQRCASGSTCWTHIQRNFL